MSGESWVVNSEHSKQEFIKEINRLFDKNKYITFSWKTGKQRTNTQNAALHLYLKNLAIALNEAGYDVKKTLRSDIEHPWTQSRCKELLFKPILEAITDKKSTTEAHRTEYSEVYDILARHLGQKFGITVPWPERGNI